ncbi:MAG: hypothetical protein R3208_16410 [Ketobacteraceae bacterium]|nr:hypothetical protein [Ketobacteraceae bacterium]
MKRLFILIVISGCFLPVSRAADNNTFNVNGFFSAGAGILSSDEITLNGYDEAPDFRQDSIFGIQLARKLNEQFAVTGQLVARGQDSFDAEVAWAYATYVHSPETYIRAGRVRLPLFFYSDQQEVGYTYPWIRPPVEVYQFPFSSLEAVDISHSMAIDGGSLEMQFYLGSLSEDIEGVAFEIEEVTGIILQLRHHHLRLRLGYNQGDVTRPVEGTPLETLVATNDAFVSEDYLIEFYSAAIRYDTGRWFAFGEWTRINSESALSPDRDGWLVQGGTYINDATLHLTYSRLDQRLRSGTTGEQQKPFLNEEHSVTTGLRYDLDEGIALKLELQYQEELRVQGLPGENGTLYSAAVDMVF